MGSWGDVFFVTGAVMFMLTMTLGVVPMLVIKIWEKFR